MTAKKLKVKDLRWKCSKDYLKFYKDPKKFQGTNKVVGQPRALAALQTGLGLNRAGFNIFVAGMAGTGRTKTIRRTIEHLKPVCKEILDRCYVYNFSDSSKPILLTFPRGKGREFRDDMRDFVQVLKSDIPKTLEASHVVKERELIVERYQRAEKKIFEKFAERLKSEGFALIQVQEGSFVAPMVFPVIGEEAVAVDALDGMVKDGKLTAKERDEKVSRYGDLSAELKKVLTKARQLGKEMHRALDKLLQRTCALILDGVMDDLRVRYTDEKVRKYLLRVKNHILKNAEDFAGKKEDARPEGMLMIAPQKSEDPSWVYEVNLLNDDEDEPQDTKLCPIVEENNPSFVNMFGAIEYNLGPGGAWHTDFRRIKAGSLLQADGGYLIVNALDVLRRPQVWDHLKRILKSEKLIIQQPEMTYQLAPLAIKPEPIEISVKLVMIGPSWLYHMLWHYDDDFSKAFKILADFDSSMQLNHNSAKQFAQVLKSVCDRGEMHPPTADGMAALIEHGVEESGQRDRLSTRFTYITDVLREADHLAAQSGAKQVTRKHVDEAVQERRYRHGMAEERMQRLIDEGVLLIDTKGKKVGQLNGLAVYSLGSTSFGKPSRITAITSLGKAGVVNIEREANLSGPSHNKGMLILTGYLRRKYAQKFPLSFSASIAFEQSYGGVDGDSASSTEIYALLSSFSGVPIDQGIAVTGSVNQMGEVQPIGGVNEKIEGFFDVCKAKGLTGKQGVMIPHQNERHLMLRQDVLDAVGKGKFHVYSVKNIDEGIEVLMKKPAGRVMKSGNYPHDSLHGLVHDKLKQMGLDLINFGNGEEEDEGEEELTKKKSKKKKQASKKKAKKKRK